MASAPHSPKHWLRPLLVPVLLNITIAAICVALLQEPLGWLAQNRQGYPRWVANGLPFLQFMAVAFLFDRMFRVIAEFLNARDPKKHGLPKLALQLFSTLIYASFLGASVSVVFGESIGGILAASGIVGLAVGFAVRGILADIFSGIALNLDDNLTPGDWLDVVQRRRYQRSGRLVDIHWRAVVLADSAGNHISIPNSEFAAATITNRSRPTAATRYSVPLPVGSEYDRAEISEVLNNALNRVMAEGTMLSQPKPYVRVDTIEADVVTYRLFYYIDHASMSPTKTQSAILGYALDFLKASGIRFRTVTETEYRRPSMPGSDRSTELSTRLRVLANVPLLSVLSPSQLAELATHSQLTYFTKGEQVMKAGENGDSMVVVLEGRLNITVDSEDGLRHVATLWPGECAGEMSLLTGSPRSATVQAATASTLMEVPKAALTPILQANPLLVERIAATIDRRQATAQGADGEKKHEDHQKAYGGLVSKIRDFFRI